MSRAAWLGVLVLALAACGGEPPAGDRDPGAPLRVTATTSMLADLARNVGGERVAVTGLMGLGVDPHLYRATQGDLRLLREADLVLYNGLYLEGRMSDVLGQMARRTRTLALAEALPGDMLLESAEFEGNYDPHIWFDAALWRDAAGHLRDALQEMDPGHAEVYAENTARYQAELDTLHAHARERIAEIPEERRVLVTAHDAFGYFGRAYDIEVMGIQGVSTAAEFGLRDINRLVDVLVEREIKAVFIETTVAPRSIEALIAGARSRGHDVRLGGSLFSDAMGPEDTPEGTYLGMFRHNVDTIVEALR